MKAVKVTQNVYWVGAIDWKLRNFHGYSTGRGSTYNAYLILGEEITLIDTVKAPFADEMIERISDVCDISKIKNIIINHAEPDHSGALPRLLELVPNAKVYASNPSGGKIIGLHYGDRIVQGIATGTELNLGGQEYKFITTPMVHWPDNMVTYLTKEKILFSNDAFGQHLASEERFDTEYSLNITLHEAKKYYANIVLPYGAQARKAIEAVSGMDIQIIAPSHGLIWTEHVSEILSKYKQWASSECEERAVIVYDTMWQSTEKMAKAIAEGFIVGGKRVNMMDVQTNHISDIITQVMDAKYICVGSPTLNNGIMPTVASFLCYMKGLAPAGERKSVAFGSYGWGGQSVGIVEKELAEMKFTPLCESIKCQYAPTSEFLRATAQKITEAVK